MKINLKSTNTKQFYKLSLYMLGYYITLFVISCITTILNYEASRIGVDTSAYRISSMVLSSFGSLLVVIFWFIGREQQDGIRFIMNKRAAWVLNVVVDLFELAYICLSTIASLYNGGVIKQEFTVLMPAVSFSLVLVSAFDFSFALACTILAKRKTQR